MAWWPTSETFWPNLKLTPTLQRAVILSSKFGYSQFRKYQLFFWKYQLFLVNFLILNILWIGEKSFTIPFLLKIFPSSLGTYIPSLKFYIPGLKKKRAKNQIVTDFCYILDYRLKNWCAAKIYWYYDIYCKKNFELRITNFELRITNSNSSLPNIWTDDLMNPTLRVKDFHIWLHTSSM